MTACGDIRTKFSAMLDRELRQDEFADVQDHLQACDECRQQWQELKAVDERLKSLLTIDDLAAKVARIKQTAAVRSPPSATRHRSLARWATMIAAVAATILLTWIATRPREAGPGPKPAARVIVARLVRATGVVEIRSPDSARWVAIDEVESFAVAKGSRLRTGENILCEFETKDEAKFRLDQSAEVVLHDTDKVELLKGQLWALAPMESGLDIEMPLQHESSPKTATMSCPSAAEIQCVAGNSYASCDSVSPKNAPAELAIGTFKCPVAPGETVSIDAKQNVDRKTDPNVPRKIWQLPLLAVGHGVDDELIGSMSGLLAPIGETKARHLNEQQIRSLGPSGALPLLAYVQSVSAPDQLRLRRTAINIAADLADQRAIEVLQELTSDPDPSISRRASDALKKIAQEAD